MSHVVCECAQHTPVAGSRHRGRKEKADEMRVKGRTGENEVPVTGSGLPLVDRMMMMG